MGRELVEVYREGGPEWDGERGRVMVAMATTDRYATNADTASTSHTSHISHISHLPLSTSHISHITYSSLLDEALSLLEGVVSCSHYTLTPSHTRYQALPHLATAHTLKAIADLQGRMG